MSNKYKQAIANAMMGKCIAYKKETKAVLNEMLEIVQSIVRCKDCKHYHNSPNGLCYLHTEPCDNAKGYKGEAVCVEDNSFCSFGERKK